MKTPDRVERELLSAYREGERLPDARRVAAWSRLQTAIHSDELHDELAAPDPRAHPRRSRWGVALLAAAAILVLIAGLRGRADRARDDRDSQAAHDAAERARPQVPELRAPTPTPRSDAAVPPPEPTPVAPEAPRAVPRAPAGAGLDAELALLRGARAALTAGTGAEALALLAEHERRFPGGHLAEERMVLRVQALCAVDRRAEARAAATRFAAQHPGSPHTATIADMCKD